jgi:hypothetical protein
MASSSLLQLPHEIRSNILHQVIFHRITEPYLCYQCANAQHTLSIYPHLHHSKQNRASWVGLREGVLLTCHQLRDEAKLIFHGKTATATAWLKVTPNQGSDRISTITEMLSVRNKSYELYQQAHLFGYFYKQILSLQLTVQIKDDVKQFPYYLSTLLEFLTAVLRWSPHITRLSLNLDLCPFPHLWREGTRLHHEIYNDQRHGDIAREIVKRFARVRGFAHVEVSGCLHPSVAIVLARQMMAPDIQVTERDKLLGNLRLARSRENWVDIARLICFENGIEARGLLGVPTLIVANMKKRACEQWARRLEITGTAGSIACGPDMHTLGT